MIDDVLQAEFPEHTQKLFHDNFSYCNPYRISVNTILNKDNKTVEDVITQRGKYPLPPMKEMTFLTGMVARNAAKTLSGSEYSEFLTFLSERPGDFCYVHPAYSCLEEITISAIRYFRYKNTQKAKKESQRIPLEPDAEQCA